MNRTDWNRLADHFDDAVCDVVANDRRGVLAGLVNRVFRRHRRPVVVDLGCGPGTFIKQFGPRFDRVVGVDYAPRMIAEARRRCAFVPHARWLCSSVERAPSLLGPVADLVVCLNVLTETATRRRETQWASIAAVNKPGGFTLIVLPSVESARHVARVTGGPAPVRRGSHCLRRRGRLQKLYTREELLDCFSRVGYRSVQVKRVCYPWHVEGVSPRPATSARLPWHWACLAVRRRT